MAVRTIEDVKADIDASWVEYTTLQTELGAIVSTQNVVVDLTKSLDDFMRLAEEKFNEKRRTYMDEVKAKNVEIKTKMNDINTLLDEARTLLFDDNGVVYNQP